MRYENIQGLRAIAASMVVIGHAGLGGVITLPFWVDMFANGGVDLFFVISGFIICEVAANSNRGPLDFLGRRLWRIFPLYWIVLCVSAGMWTLGIFVWNQTVFPLHPAIDYILLLTTANRFLPAAWTLVFELYFYVCVSIILIASRKYFYPILAFWIFGEVVSIAALGPNGPPPISAMSLDFAFGCIIAWLNAKNMIRYNSTFGAIGLIFFACGDWVSATVPFPPGIDLVTRLLTLGIGSALIVYAAVGFERCGLKFSRVLSRLGDASYSLYLWHGPLIVFAMKFGVGPLIVPLIFATALASYRWIEAPLLRADLAVLGGTALRATALARVIISKRMREAQSR